MASPYDGTRYWCMGCLASDTYIKTNRRMRDLASPLIYLYSAYLCVRLCVLAKPACCKTWSARLVLSMQLLAHTVMEFVIATACRLHYVIMQDSVECDPGYNEARGSTSRYKSHIFSHTCVALLPPTGLAHKALQYAPQGCKSTCQSSTSSQRKETSLACRRRSAVEQTSKRQMTQSRLCSTSLPLTVIRSS